MADVGAHLRGAASPSVYVLAVVAIAMAFVLHKSVFGRYLFAVGKNEEAARFSGIRDRQP
jgi:ribose transport system permease protein